MEPTNKKFKVAGHKCNICGKSFAQKQSLCRHKKTAHAMSKWRCKTCNTTFTRKDNYQRHMKKYESSIVQTGSGDTRNGSKKLGPCNFRALNGTVETHTIHAEGMCKFDPMTFLKSKYDDLKDVIKQAIKERGGIKWYVSMRIKMSRRKEEEIETAEPHFRGKCQTSLKFEDIDEGLRESIKKMFNSFIEYQRQGSNWTVDKVVDLTVHMARYRPLRGSSYIPLPIKLRTKRAIINVKNKDNKCFMWSVLAALYPPQRDAERIWKYKNHITSLKFSGIPYPVKMVDIPKFEKQNNISVNVFGFEKNEVFPVHIAKNRYERHVNLLLLSDNKKSHYCWIKDLNKTQMVIGITIVPTVCMDLRGKDY